MRACNVELGAPTFTFCRRLPFHRPRSLRAALDNESARRHVNRMCLAAGVPLVEAGTAGFQGQAYPIAKGATACYECNPPAAQKTYPICTIRR